MKKQLVTILGVAVMAAPAFASKARLQALGEDIYGSTYINDNRNVFLNVANVNNHKDLVTFEWGDTTQSSDTVATPRADGGVFFGHGNLVYGIYLGDETNDAHLMRRAAGLSAAGSKEENNIGLFVGGDAGLKWGASLVYSKSENDEATGATSEEQKAMRTRLGVILNNGTEVFSTINLVNEAKEASGAEFKGKLGYRIGAIHNLNDIRLYGTWTSLTGENDVSGNEQKLTLLDVGAGRAEKINDKFTLFTKVAFNMLKTENEDKNGQGFGNAFCQGGITAGGASASILNCEEYQRNSVPVVIGMEYSAASWLALRGSISQSIYSMEEDNKDKRSSSETTVVNAGASLLFGEMTVDGVVGNSVDGSTVGSNTGSGKGQLRTDNLLTRVSMTYRF